jgi:Ca-activated chloride channel homolog
MDGGVVATTGGRGWCGAAPDEGNLMRKTVGLCLVVLLCVAIGACASRKQIMSRQPQPTAVAPAIAPSASPVLGASIRATSMPEYAGETYESIEENAYQSALQQPYSTFAVDVDTASYSNVRRFLRDGVWPPPDAVRVEELINYFEYAYPAPLEDQPLNAYVEVGACPWSEGHRLVHIGLRTPNIDLSERLRTNIVFLLDVSGSMSTPDKLPLLKRGMQMLVRHLGEDDRVGIVTYAGQSRTVLRSTRCTERGKARILDAIACLESGGSTNGGAGIRNAYDMARTAFVENGANRVILATDGDFNVGITDRSDLIAYIERQAASGVFLTVLGFGTGNLKDATLEQLADHGNGHYAYVDSLSEARKVLIEEMGATLVTVAKDVKVQVEFNPARVGAYRLVGYENRMLEARDFKDDTKDAGDLGAGHSVTVLYEIVPPEKVADAVGVDPLRYQRPGDQTAFADSAELLHLKVRYKRPDQDASKGLDWIAHDRPESLEAASDDFHFAAAVAGFGMLLRDSKHKGTITFDDVINLAVHSKGFDELGYRAEFVALARDARALMETKTAHHRFHR